MKFSLLHTFGKRSSEETSIEVIGRDEVTWRGKVIDLRLGAAVDRARAFYASRDGRTLDYADFGVK